MNPSWKCTPFVIGSRLIAAFLLIAFLIVCIGCSSEDAEPSEASIIGEWEGTVEFLEPQTQQLIENQAWIALKEDGTALMTMEMLYGYYLEGTYTFDNNQLTISTINTGYLPLYDMDGTVLFPEFFSGANGLDGTNTFLKIEEVQLTASNLSGTLSMVNGSSSTSSSWSPAVFPDTRSKLDATVLTVITDFTSWSGDSLEGNAGSVMALAGSLVDYHIAFGFTHAVAQDGSMEIYVTNSAFTANQIQAMLIAAITPSIRLDELTSQDTTLAEASTGLMNSPTLTKDSPLSHTLTDWTIPEN